MLHHLAILKCITNKTERSQMVEAEACKTNEDSMQDRHSARIHLIRSNTRKSSGKHDDRGHA
jgi:hypothetical protein